MNVPPWGYRVETRRLKCGAMVSSVIKITANRLSSRGRGFSRCVCLASPEPIDFPDINLCLLSFYRIASCGPDSPVVDLSALQIDAARPSASLLKLELFRWSFPESHPTLRSRVVLFHSLFSLKMTHRMRTSSPH